MKNWPAWIPNLNAWMSAILLLLLVWGIQVLIRYITALAGGLAFALPPNLQILLYLAAILSPIAVIALVHHYLNLILDRFFPNTQPPEMERINGLFPSLMSWWEGVFGWQAIALATVVSFFIKLIVFLPSNTLLAILDGWTEARSFFTVTNFIQLVTLAYLYQLEQLVRRHLMTVGARR